MTATEFAGHEDAVPLSRQLVFDEAHRHVFRIHGTGGSRLDPDVGMLAFAARATASFPGAFAPVSLNHFRGQLSAAGQGAGWDSLERRYLERYPDDNEAGDRRFVDGGVLDNMPFDAAIGLIRRRTAASEVRRAVVYVEPSPTVMANADALALRDLDVPESNVLAETFRSVSTIPLSQTMGDQIAALRRRNARVLALRSVIEQRFDAVAARVDEVAAAAAAEGANPLIDPAAAASPAWWDAVSAAAHASDELTPTYSRVKIGHVVDHFAEAVADACGYADGLLRELVAEVIGRYAVAEGILPDVDQTQPQPDGLSDRQIGFLRAFDVDYEQRRIAFTRDGAAWLYRPGGDTKEHAVDRAGVDSVKSVLAGRAAALRGVWDALMADDKLRAQATTVFGRDALRALIPPPELDPSWDLDERLEEFIKHHLQALRALEKQATAQVRGVMDGFGQETFAALLEALSDWSGERGKALRLDLLRRYVGFPIWDAITYPIAVEHEVGERDGEIGIYRVSPRETSLVSPPDPKVPKLAGMSVHHFGAFFDRSSREKDYLWGRIDGCCQLITLMLDVLRDRGSTDAIQPSALMRRACVAVLTEEWPHVPGAHDLAEHLWRQVSDDPHRHEPPTPAHTRQELAEREERRSQDAPNRCDRAARGGDRRGRHGAGRERRADLYGGGRPDVGRERSRGRLDGGDELGGGGLRPVLAGRPLAAVPDRRRSVARRPGGVQPHLLPGHQQVLRRRKRPHGRPGVLHSLLGRRGRDRGVRAAVPVPVASPRRILDRDAARRREVRRRLFRPGAGHLHSRIAVTQRPLRRIGEALRLRAVTHNRRLMPARGRCRRTPAPAG